MKYHSYTVCLTGILYPSVQKITVLMTGENVLQKLEITNLT